MDTVDLHVMSHPPFDPFADVRITHTVRQARADGVDRNTAGGGLILNNYLRGPSVGKGQHGTVYKCWDLAQNSVEVVRHNLPLPLFLFFYLCHYTSPLPPHPLTWRMLIFVACMHPLACRLSRSCRATTLAQTASTSSSGSASHAQDRICLSPITSAAKNTKSEKRSPL